MAERASAEQLTDSELLSTLGAALRPPEAPVPDAGLAALRAALDERGSLVPAPLGWPDRLRSALNSRWRKAGAATALVAGLVVGGTGVAFAAGGNVPEPLRAVAYNLGLPVDSPAVSATHQDVSRLRNALKSASPGPAARPSSTTSSSTTANLGTSSTSQAAGAAGRTDQAAYSAAVKLARQLSHLSPTDQKRLGLTPWKLLADAQRLEASHGVPISKIPSVSEWPAWAEKLKPWPTVPDTRPTPTVAPITTVPVRPQTPTPAPTTSPDHPAGPAPTVGHSPVEGSTPARTHSTGGSSTGGSSTTKAGRATTADHQSTYGRRETSGASRWKATPVTEPAEKAGAGGQTPRTR